MSAAEPVNRPRTMLFSFFRLMFAFGLLTSVAIPHATFTLIKAAVLDLSSIPNSARQQTDSADGLNWKSSGDELRSAPSSNEPSILHPDSTNPEYFSFQFAMSHWGSPHHCAELCFNVSQIDFDPNSIDSNRHIHNPATFNLTNMSHRCNAWRYDASIPRCRNKLDKASARQTAISSSTTLPLCTFLSALPTDNAHKRNRWSKHRRHHHHHHYHNQQNSHSDLNEDESQDECVTFGERASTFVRFPSSDPASLASSRTLYPTKFRRFPSCSNFPSGWLQRVLQLQLTG